MPRPPDGHANERLERVVFPLVDALLEGQRLGVEAHHPGLLAEGLVGVQGHGRREGGKQVGGELLVLGFKVQAALERKWLLYSGFS